MTGAGLFDRFAPVLTAPQPPVVRDARLLIERDGDLAVYYAPFEFLNPQARLVLVGITPGPTQMVNANRAARAALLAGASAAEAMRAAKETGAFSGEPLRSNLICQLNHWGFQHWLGLPDAAELFAGARRLVQTTSLLRYPVFVRDADYRGTPDMTRQPLLRRCLLQHFAAEVAQLPDAIFVGLGPKVQQVLSRLVAEGRIDGRRVIGGMLHPSGNCTYRIRYLTGDRSRPAPHATNPQPYDEGRRAFRRQYLGLTGPD